MVFPGNERDTDSNKITFLLGWNPLCPNANEVSGNDV